MRFIFRSNKVRDLYTDEKGAQRYSEGVVDAFFEVMAIIEAAPDERDLRSLKSLRYEKLKGARGKRGERSLRLNRQFRLTLTVESDDEGQFLRIIDIEPHYE